MQRKDITDLMILVATKKVKERNNTYTCAYELLEHITKAPSKVIWRAIQRCEGRGYIESGVSLRNAWITEEGQYLLDNSNIEDVFTNKVNHQSEYERQMILECKRRNDIRIEKLKNDDDPFKNDPLYNIFILHQYLLEKLIWRG